MLDGILCTHATTYGVCEKDRGLWGVGKDQYLQGMVTSEDLRLHACPERAVDCAHLLEGRDCASRIDVSLHILIESLQRKIETRRRGTRHQPESSGGRTETPEMRSHRYLISGYLFHSPFAATSTRPKVRTFTVGWPGTKIARLERV